LIFVRLNKKLLNDSTVQCDHCIHEQKYSVNLWAAVPAWLGLLIISCAIDSYLTINTNTNYFTPVIYLMTMLVGTWTTLKVLEVK